MFSNLKMSEERSKLEAAEASGGVQPTHPPVLDYCEVLASGYHQVGAPLLVRRVVVRLGAASRVDM